MRIRSLHPWDLGYHTAVALQTRLASRVCLTPLPIRRVRFVAGADVSFDKASERAFAAVVVFELPSLDLVESHSATTPLRFPYIPGLLSFREIPSLIECFRRVKTPVDLVLCDGQGIAHPRRFGLASHLGIVLDTPTIGCAKSLLVGEHGPLGTKRGDFARLIYEDAQVGSALRTQRGVRPVYVSPGHRVDHPSCRRLVLASTTRYRLPEPTRWADRLAGEEKRRTT